MLRIQGLRLEIDDEMDKLPAMAAKRMGIRIAEIKSWNVYKKSLDARKKGKIYFVFTLDVSIKNEKNVLSRLNDPGIMMAESENYRYVSTGTEKLKNNPVIVGSGPAGLFAGLLLSEMGYCPIILERGKEVDKRVKDIEQFWKSKVLDKDSNVQFGEGGAGTFSDGKLTTLIKDVRCRKVLAEFVAAGAPEELMYTYKPHIGTDILRRVIKNIRHKIEQQGGIFQFGARVSDFIIHNDKLTALIVNGSEKIIAEAVILATGHSARDVFHILFAKGVRLTAKQFSIGLRIEHLQKDIDRAQYKSFYGHPSLGPADYKLACHLPEGRSAYTFCMCPGGEVVAASSEDGQVVTNGMSIYARNGINANSALLVGVRPDDFESESPLAGIEFQRKWERNAFLLGGNNYAAPIQLVGDFLQNRESKAIGAIRPTYPCGSELADLNQCLPDYVARTLQKALTDFDRKIRGFAREDAVLTAIETRSSSPVRIIRGIDHISSVEGLYPAGEGAGYAGGIISAAVDGIRTAEAVVAKYKPISAARIIQDFH